jgi:hypothetical protein
MKTDVSKTVSDMGGRSSKTFFKNGKVDVKFSIADGGYPLSTRSRRS